jgi:hypothetical protein
VHNPRRIKLSYHPLTTNSIIFFLDDQCFINQPQLQTNQQAGTIHSQGHKNNKDLTTFTVPNQNKQTPAAINPFQ